MKHRCRWCGRRGYLVRYFIASGDSWFVVLACTRHTAKAQAVYGDRIRSVTLAP